MSKRVLVTGGAGFVGANIIGYILDKYDDYLVINFDVLTSSASLSRLDAISDNQRYTFVKGDITNESDVKDVFEQYRPDYIIHLASQSYIDKDIHQPSIFIQTNVVGTQLLLLTMRDKKGIKMVYLSNSKVYGTFREEKEIDEDSPLLPYGFFAASKASAELFVTAANRSHNLNVNIIRPTNVYGEYQFPEKLIPTVVENILNGKKIPVFGQGNSFRDWLYINDFCKAVDKVLHEGVAGEIYNVSSGTSIKNIEVIRIIQEKMGTTQLEFFPERLGDESYPAIKSDKIKSQLGWHPEFDLNQGLDKTIEWYKNHQDWIDEIYTKNCRGNCQEKDLFEDEFGELI